LFTTMWRSGYSRKLRGGRWPDPQIVIAEAHNLLTGNFNFLRQDAIGTCANQLIIALSASSHRIISGQPLDSGTLDNELHEITTALEIYCESRSWGTGLGESLGQNLPFKVDTITVRAKPDLDVPSP